MCACCMSRDTTVIQKTSVGHILTEIEQFSRKLVNFCGFKLTPMRIWPTEIS
jgi:hypothetical protein